MNITSGKIMSAQKTVIYGPEGIGKTTFASMFPHPLFIDTEGSTKHIDVNRFEDKPQSWQMLLEQVNYVKTHPEICLTLVIDTADWAEQLAVLGLCAAYQKKSIEDFGYGKGYVYLQEYFGKLLNSLDEVIARGINVVMTAHAKMRKFEQPDEMGAYDRWEMKLSKNVAPMVKEWADMVLFANYETHAVKVDDKKYKAQGGKRVMFTTHNPCWDAKNRHSLPEKTEFSFSAIAHAIPSSGTYEPIGNPVPVHQPNKEEIEKLKAKIEEFIDDEVPHSDIPPALSELMKANNVTEQEIMDAVASRGYFPAGTPISNYGDDFINGCLIGAWEQVYKMICENRNK